MADVDNPHSIEIERLLGNFRLHEEILFQPINIINDNPLSYIYVQKTLRRHEERAGVANIIIFYLKNRQMNFTRIPFYWKVLPPSLPVEPVLPDTHINRVQSFSNRVLSAIKDLNRGRTISVSNSCEIVAKFLIGKALIVMNSFAAISIELDGIGRYPRRDEKLLKLSRIIQDTKWLFHEFQGDIYTIPKTDNTEFPTTAYLNVQEKRDDDDPRQKKYIWMLSENSLVVVNKFNMITRMLPTRQVQITVSPRPNVFPLRALLAADQKLGYFRFIKPEERHLFFTFQGVRGVVNLTRMVFSDEITAAAPNKFTMFSRNLPDIPLVSVQGMIIILCHYLKHDDIELRMRRILCGIVNARCEWVEGHKISACFKIGQSWLISGKKLELLMIYLTHFILNDPRQGVYSEIFERGQASLNVPPNGDEEARNIGLGHGFGGVEITGMGDSTIDGKCMLGSVTHTFFWNTAGDTAVLTHDVPGEARNLSSDSTESVRSLNDEVDLQDIQNADVAVQLFEGDALGEEVVDAVVRDVLPVVPEMTNGEGHARSKFQPPSTSSTMLRLLSSLDRALGN